MLMGIVENTAHRYNVNISFETIYNSISNLPDSGFKVIDFFNVNEQLKPLEATTTELIHSISYLNNEIHLSYGVFESMRDLNDFVLLHLLLDTPTTSMVRDSTAVLAILALMHSGNSEQILLRNSSVQQLTLRKQADEKIREFTYKVYKNVVLKDVTLPRERILNFLYIKNKLDMYGFVEIPLDTYIFFSKKLDSLPYLTTTPVEKLEEAFFRKFYK